MQPNGDPADDEKNELKPWRVKSWVIPPKASGEFVAAMEDVLEVYKRRPCERRALVCLDETSKQLTADTREPIPMSPGSPKRVDYEYRRNGVANLFMMFDPHAAWRHVKVTERRARIDFAECVRELVDEWYPDAKKIVLVMDNLNTHSIGSLYEAFEAKEARRLAKAVEITPAMLFRFDNAFVVEGLDVTTGEHVVELKKKGTGPLYYNGYLTNFTLEDPITAAGLEIKVDRKYYKLNRVEDATAMVAGGHGQVIDQKIEKYEREELADFSSLESGDIVEVELTIESKNDYESLVFEDFKPAGFESVEVRSGYNGNAMRAYVEFRDNRVCFFVSNLARGKHSVSYKLRAEIPGSFSALPAKGWAMYAPELKANSNEFKVGVHDKPIEK